MVKSFLASFILGFVLSGCKSDHAVEAYTFQIREIPQELKVPSEIKRKWDELQVAGELTQLLRIKLTLSEKNHGVLKHPEIDVLFPPGGGELDFSKLITNDKGTFRLKWLEPSGNPFVHTDIYFIPQSGSSLVGEETWGDPCDKLIEISTFGQKISKEGIDLNVTDFRHIRLMGGSFVFLRKSEKTFEVAQISFSDSRFVEKKCKIS